MPGVTDNFVVTFAPNPPALEEYFDLNCGAFCGTDLPPLPPITVKVACVTPSGTIHGSTIFIF